MEQLQEITFTNRVWVLMLPIILMTFDIVTGWIQASVNDTWESTKMRKGLFRKSGELSIIVIAYVVYVAISLPVDVPAFIAVYISIMEILSVCENLDQAGVPMPVWITRKLKKVAQDLNEPEDTEHDDTGKGD